LTKQIDNHLVLKRRNIIVIPQEKKAVPLFTVGNFFLVDSHMNLPCEPFLVSIIISAGTDGYFPDSLAGSSRLGQFYGTDTLLKRSIHLIGFQT